MDNLTKTSVTNAIASGKDLVALLRDSLLFVIGLLLLFFPNRLNDVLVKAGFEEGSVVGFKWKAGLAKSDLALRESQSVNYTLKSQLDSMSKLLREAQSKITDPQFKVKVSEAEKKNAQIKAFSRSTQQSISSTLSSNSALVKSAQESVNQNSSWGVVFSGDATLAAAKYEIEVAAPKLGIPNAVIYHRQGSFRSVSIVNDRQEAEQILIKAKKRRMDSYIVPMSTWCQNFKQESGFLECL